MTRPLRPCNQVGCPQLVRPPERYCPAHRWTEAQRERERQRWYDEHQRDERARRFYHSPEWRALRAWVLARDAYLCQRCLRQQRITRATTVHHIVPIRVDWSRRLDPANCQSVCARCHGEAEAEARRATRRR